MSASLNRFLIRFNLQLWKVLNLHMRVAISFFAACPHTTPKWNYQFIITFGKCVLLTFAFNSAFFNVTNLDLFSIISCIILVSFFFFFFNFLQSFFLNSFFFLFINDLFRFIWRCIDQSFTNLLLFHFFDNFFLLLK